MDGALLDPSPWMIGPFVLLLGCIALGPLAWPKGWHQHYPKVALGLGTVTLLYYWLGLNATGRIAHTAHEYVSFIALIGSLFVVSGGIHITVRGEATPIVNTLFLLIGAIVANLLGTTGASMLLIRPWLRMNKYRLTAHHVVFFIFIVSNVGGCLTPIGDPPLFLGYLKGVPFWWVLEHCWPMWIVGVGSLLGIFYVLDRRNYLRAPATIREKETGTGEQWRFRGLHNLLFLAVILGAVFLERPPFIREMIMIAAAIGSYLTTPRAVHEANDFNFEPIREVAILFVGIFATMMPALDWLQNHARDLGRPTPSMFYWGTGSLSAVLDNAPTYLSFLSTAQGMVAPAVTLQPLQLALAQGIPPDPTSPEPVIREALRAMAEYFPEELTNRQPVLEHLQLAVLLASPNGELLLVAISIAAVFFGACTYIGNGPNFMVKAIAEHQKAHVPTFLGYVFKFTLPYLLPVLALTWWLFFR
ncbi:MAG: sodium:proton antiporter [Verrucomicrobiota bacterium]|nr:sodium:proton antiporter [Limisphaera sp.]MDW8381883.1 sodium:proton antiporter [Verrucomicrobiota bacterium]